MAKADARKAKEPPRQALDTIKRLSGAVLSSRDEQRLYDAHRSVLRAYRALIGSGLEGVHRATDPDAVAREVDRAPELSGQAPHDE